MLKFRPSNLTQKHGNISFNELQLIGLIEKGLSDNSLRGYLYKRSSPNAKWRLKWFLLFENLLFYFDVGSSEQQAQSQHQSKQDQQHQQQQQQQQQDKHAAEFAISKSPRRTLSSLIKRGQTKQQSAGCQQQQQSRRSTTCHETCADWQQLEFPDGSRRTPAAPIVFDRGLHGDPQPTACQPAPPLHRRASASEPLAPAEKSGCCKSTGQQQQQQATVAAEGSGCQSHSHQHQRGRISSDPQRAVASDSISLNYCSGGGDRTLNSSSISGVSGHFSAHNEQTIGRSTTTTAGKTATASTNYASLLSRRIGVVFLEGSYCERLADSAPDFHISSSSLLSPTKSQAPSKSPTKKSNRPACAGDQSACESPVAGKSSATTRSSNNNQPNLRLDSEFNCIFTLKWKKEGSKEYQFRSETEAECHTWVHAISNARYSTLLNDKEQLEQKYLHLTQIIESESTAKWQYSRQCEEFLAEIKKLRQEICVLKRQESRSNHLRLVLTKSAAIVDTLMRQQRQRRLNSQTPESPSLAPAATSQPAAATRDHYHSRSTQSSPSKHRAPGTGSPLDRARSIEQEQEEHEVAVRRTRTNLMRLASMSQPPQSQPQQPASRLDTKVSPSPSPVARAGNDARANDADEDADEEDEERALRIELKSVVEALNSGLLVPADCLLGAENTEELRKIKKVQGFFRGWLCRRRWKQIVQEYIKSPHAESMRKRNNLVFRMVECEEEYVEQLTLLIAAFLRPIKMAASSQRPALDHDELNSIFLNSETLLFLHQIFLKGLTARMESWPTLVLGDLFNMLLPMLQIYQEYVRNHHFSLQVLAECKQREQFSQILRRLEEKPQLNGRTLETFLTYPMHQIPRYIICLHEILAHTPHNHVERKSLYEAQTKLEELSRQMHDEVSETENIRQNLAIERMIIGGCDILLDVNQVFVRQGILLQVVEAGGKCAKSNRCRLTSFGARNQASQQPQSGADHHNPQSAQVTTTTMMMQINLGTANQQQQHHPQACDSQQTKELIRQCFLFTNHLLLCTRTKDGKLHLLEGIGRVSLSEVTLIENPIEFIQQQETITANFESIPALQQQQQPQPQYQLNQQQRAEVKDTNSSYNSVPDCSAQNYADGSTGWKRTSTGSAPGKWVAGEGKREKRTSHVEFELDATRRQSQQESATSKHQKRASSVFSGSQCSPDEWSSSASSSQPGRRKGSSVSSRSRIAGYLATKLSNLASLGYSPSTSHTSETGCGGGATLSAPSSPLTKRGLQQMMPSPLRSSSNQSGQQLNKSNNNNANNQHYYLQNLFNLSKDYGGCDFILLLECNTNLSASSSTLHSSAAGGSATTGGGGGGATGGGSGSGNAGGITYPLAIHLVAPNLQEKAAWMSDISQCIDNVHFNDLFHGSVNDSSSLTINQSVRTDPRLYKDDVDIKFSRALNSCKLPQIRYASKERLFERLTDLRFLSIDFLNTFLLTYRVFTTAEDVLEALKSVHYNCDRIYQQQQQQQQQQQNFTQEPPSQPTKSDSLSAFANSSLVSLDNNSNNKNDGGTAQTEPAGNRQVPPDVPASGDQQKTQVRAQQQQPSTVAPQATSCNKPTPINQQHRPSVPPRLEQASNKQPEASGKFLLAPGGTQVHQKRRSTISALTPITGSTSSSLANLACATNKCQQQLQQHEQGTTRPSLQSTGGNSSPNSSVFRMSELGRSSSNTNLDDDLLASMHLSDEYLTDHDLLFADQNQPPAGPLDRARSSSMSNAAQLARVAAATVASVARPAITAPTQRNLDVPGGRQVRASSLSHVAGQVRRGLAQPAAGNEHWRLSYKKATGKQDDDCAPNDGGKSFLSATRLDCPNTNYRRASSSDVTFRVTVHVSSEAPQASSSLDKQSMPGASRDTVARQDDDDMALLILPTPTVPPSSPVELALDDGDDDVTNCDNNEKESPQRPDVEQKRHGHHRRQSSTDNKKPKRESRRKRRTTAIESTGSSALESAEDSDTSEISVKSTSGSESILIHTSSGDTSTHSSSLDLGAKGGEQLPLANGHPSGSRRTVRLNKRRVSRSESSKAKIAGYKQPTLAGDNERPLVAATSAVMLKEIELTDAKVLDYDTSADEDKLVTSSSDHEESSCSDSELAANGDNNSKLAGGENDDDDDDDKSFKLLARLNSVHLDDDNFESDHEESGKTPARSKDDKLRRERKSQEKRQHRDAREHLASTAEEPANSQETTRNDVIGEKEASQNQKQSADNLVTTQKQSVQAETPSKTPDVAEVASGGYLRASGRPSMTTTGSSCLTTPRSSFAHHAAESSTISKAGVVVSSSVPRVSSRRSSTASAASAFAAATAASNNPLLTQPPPPPAPPASGVVGWQQPFGGNKLLSHADSPPACDCIHHQQQLAINLRRCSNASSPNSNYRGTKLNELPTARHHRILHKPTCAYNNLQQHQATGGVACSPSHSYPNVQSDASSLCNSRASSRLSSCAGLECGSYSSSANFYATQGNLINHHHQQQFSKNAQSTGVRSGIVQNPALRPQAQLPGAAIQPLGNQRATPGGNKRNSSSQLNVRSVATIRVLSVLRHWVSKHSQDFVNDTKLSYLVQEFLQDLIMDSSLLPAEHKAALQLQQMVQKSAHTRSTQVDFDLLLAAPARPSPDSIETLSALEIAEGMTYLDHKIFLAIRSEEFLGQAWMKMDKAIKAPHILLITKRFNDVSRLVSSEIIRVPELHRRVAIIEKWTNVAHICRVVHNFNGVLQICAAFTNSAVFRLKKTWDKIPKTTKTTIDQLQNLVSTDSRFRNMRDAINRCDPPSIPYVGMYLTDLSFIEEGTPNYSPDGLLNFSKMRMIAHVIREIQHLQNGSYKIELNPRVANYILDGSRHLQDDEMYRCSLDIEPRSSGGKNGVQLLNSVSGSSQFANGAPPSSNAGQNQISNNMQQQQSQASYQASPSSTPSHSKSNQQSKGSQC